MTKQEAAIVSTYTGILIGNFSETHAYIESLLNRPVSIHELTDQELWNKLKKLSRNDFISINITP